MKGVVDLLGFVSNRVQAERTSKATRAQRAADLRDLRLEAALDATDALVRERP